MRHKQKGETLLESLAGLIASLVVLAIALALSVALSSWSCGNRWADSGLKSRYKFGSGCQVQRANGSWVPERTLRDVSL